MGEGVQQDLEGSIPTSSLFGGGGPSKQQNQLYSAEAGAVNFGLSQAETTLPAATAGLTSSLNFFQTLLSGNQNAIAAAVSPDVQNIETQYTTAQRTTDEFSPRGGGATAANEESRFGEANQIANLFTQARMTGAEGVANISSLLANLGLGEMGVSTGAASSLSGQLLAQQQNEQQQQAAAGAAIGSLAALIIGA